ncbi:MAG: hypothetical protein K8R40_00740 [Anaerolineaceae bacterium]|nr:hypothetical protein [Anaerolineaceae bacterium]
MNFKKSDLSWLLGAPFYILINSLRHQLASLLLVWMTGGKILSISFLPTFGNGGWLRFSTITWQGGIDWLILSAPYIADLIIFSCFAAITYYLRIKRRWVLINLIIIGLLFPIFYGGYDYFSSVFVQTDITRIIESMPFEEVVHLYFVAALSGYILVLNAVLNDSVTAKEYHDEQLAEKRRMREIKHNVRESKRAIKQQNSEMVE